MDSEPPAMAYQRPETEGEFRREVRAELKHLREMMGHINLTLDLVLKALHADEKQDEVENG